MTQTKNKCICYVKIQISAGTDSRKLSTNVKKSKFVQKYHRCTLREVIWQLVTWHWFVF